MRCMTERRATVTSAARGFPSATTVAMASAVLGRSSTQWLALPVARIASAICIRRVSAATAASNISRRAQREGGAAAFVRRCLCGDGNKPKPKTRSRVPDWDFFRRSVRRRRRTCGLVDRWIARARSESRSRSVTDLRFRNAYPIEQLAISPAILQARDIATSYGGLEREWLSRSFVISANLTNDRERYRDQSIG